MRGRDGGRRRTAPASCGSSTMFDAEAGGRVAGVLVVVAAHQGQRASRGRACARSAWPAGCAEACAARACRKSPRNTMWRAPCCAISASSAARFSRGGPARHRHAQRAERGRLAEVDVGDDQHASRRPVQRLFGSSSRRSPATCTAEHAVATARQVRSRFVIPRPPSPVRAPCARRGRSVFRYCSFSRKRSTISAKPNGVARLTSR